MSNNIKSFQITQNNPKPIPGCYSIEQTRDTTKGRKRKTRSCARRKFWWQLGPDLNGSTWMAGSWLFVTCFNNGLIRGKKLGTYHSHLRVSILLGLRIKQKLGKTWTAEKTQNYNATLPRILTLIRRLNFADHNAKSLKQTMQGGERATNSMEFQLLVLGRSVQGFLDMPVRDNLNGSNLRGGTRQEAKPLRVKAGCV